MNENIFRQVHGYMKSKFYCFNDSWLKDCVQYCVETHPKLTIEGIQSFAKEQWLLSNLREINNENGTLPKNLAQQKCTTLPGRYILQIEKLYDISTSKYKQLEKIRNVNVVNLKATKDKKSEPWEPKGKRMYQLFLTDGVQEIQAMEYKPIRFFNETLLPGYKLMIIGPVTCRRGIIMLEEKHISGLGGEIEDLLISNSLENVLARFLNLKENPDPYNDTKRKEDSEKSDYEEEFQEYLNDLEELAGNRETKENGKPSLNLNSSVLTLQSSSEIHLQKASTEQSIDELLTEDELEELMLNDPDIVDEFPPVEYVQNRVNLQKLEQKTSFNVPNKPSLKATAKRKLSTDNSNIAGSVKNVKFQDDSFFFNNKKGELSGSWDNHKEINSGYYKTSQKIETDTKVKQVEASSISEFQDDDLILDDKDLILFDSWDNNPKGKTSNFDEPVEKSSAVQLSKLSNNNLGIEKSSNRKSLESKKPLGPCQPFKPLLEKSSTDSGLVIKKLENISMGWQMISNEVSTQKLKVIEQPKLIDVDVDLETKKSCNKNIVEKTNSFGLPKPYKPLFPKMSFQNTEKSTNANENMETKKTENEPNKGLRLFSNAASNISPTYLKVEISGNESNKSFENLNANLDSRMKKFLNEPTQNSRESLRSPAKSTSQIQNTPWRSESENSGNGYKEITIGSKRPAVKKIFPTDLKVEISGNESSKSFEDLNANLDSRMKKLLNESTQNLRENLRSPAKSTSKIQNTPWRSESENSGRPAVKKIFPTDLKEEISGSESNQSFENFNANLDSRMKKLLNEPTQNLRENLRSPVKSTSKTQNTPWRSESENSGRPAVKNIFRTDLKVEISGDESNKSFEDLNANLDSRMKKLLNESTQNLRSPAKSTSKIQNTPWRSESENSGNGYEEITIGSKRPADPGTFSTPPKMHCRLNSEKEQIKLRTKELPPKICDFICDLIKESLTDQVIRKTVRAQIKEKGKLSHKCGRWNLNGLISDGTADLNVEFSTEFMDSVIGYTALDFSLVKKQARKDPKLGERIRTNMRNAQNKLEESDWLVQLELAQNKTPIVVSGTELTEEQRTVFEKRLKILKPQYV